MHRHRDSLPRVDAPHVLRRHVDLLRVNSALCRALPGLRDA